MPRRQSRFGTQSTKPLGMQQQKLWLAPGQSMRFLLMISAGITLGVAGDYQYQRMTANAPLTATLDANSASGRQLLATSSAQGAPNNWIVAAIQQVGPAVVRLDVPLVTNSRSSATPFPSGRLEQGAGSGFIFDQSGLILTNAHVVGDLQQLNVRLKDGREFTGQVLGVDTLTDIAVVKIEGAELPTVRLGDSDIVTVGEWAIAIGNPLGLDNTVTVGIISAIDRTSREIGAPNKQIGFLQTDAAINPGNSGGPLLNATGEVIGMNTAILGGAQGLSFAIPINVAQRLAEQLVTTGKVSHPFLGIEMLDLTPELMAQLQDSEAASLIPAGPLSTEGALIVNVLPGSPAASAGLQPGDIIRAIEAESTPTVAVVQRLIAGGQVGQPLRLSILRDQQLQTVTVIPGERPAASR
ncbi:MAG: trypsin-like peptidase domain-containing protein [Cyanobacteria bacterium P01_H01_bin.121]